ncbi:MAG: M28 family peptidase [Cyclobacteriaceae bacterium]|nr:M28 family peptidase [Cyclobacteriaceae bacterium]
MRVISIGAFIVVLALYSCSGNREKVPPSKPEQPVKTVVVPQFNGDSAYHFVGRQVEFGPRIPNTPAHRKAGDYFTNQFNAYGAVVTEQRFEATTYGNQKLSLRNIIASFKPENTRRILLAAHWDTRPFADKDPQNPKAYFDGANDGASGVGVLLEIARVFHANGLPEVGVDIILFDGEDWGFDESTASRLYGNTADYKLPKNLDSWWCLGSQYWSKNRHKPNYSAYFGVLLDMVGGKDARFVKEGASMEYAPNIVDKTWKAAHQLGYGHLFLNKREGAITDDHIFVNEYARIPMINIVHYDPLEGYFGDFHHSTSDNMENISQETLEAVGRTLLHVIYNE